MNSTMLHTLITATVLWAAALASHAQSTSFTYQGRLQDGGAPVTGPQDFEFRLFNAASGGAQHGLTVTLDDLGVTNGLFTATLDFGANFPGADRFLQIAVRPGASTGLYTPLNPRQPIRSTPYAIQAANATAAGTVTGGVPAAQITGTLPLAQLPAAVVTNGASGVNISGAFTGNGAGVTNVPLGSINSGIAITWPGNFALASSLYPVSEPHSVTSADVNGDGKLDLISANFDANTLTVWTNNGSGDCLWASSYGVGLDPTSVTSADVNNDGWPDLISANSTASTLTVLTNNGSGGFALASSPSVGDGPQSVTSADVNGDGWPDLISANRGANTLTVLTNNGSGGFVVAASPGVGILPQSVTSADVNGDGRPDLISANYADNTLTVLTNNGRGGFALASSPATGTFPVSVTAADVNGDGSPDLISANSRANTLTVLTNNGSGGFVLAARPRVGNLPYSVTSADVNGDGKPDLISANYGGGFGSTLTVLTNNKSGGFDVASSPSVGLGPISITAADVNGDGRPDLISADTSADTLTVLFNTATFTGSFSGNISGLTTFDAGGLTGAVPPAALTSVPAANLTGAVPPVALTSVPAENLTGAVPPAALISVPAESLTGTIADTRLSANVAMLNASQTFGGANNFNAGVTLNPPANLSFGSQTRQMINLWNTEYALGVQGSAGYFRSGGDFFWYRGGSHSDANGNAGSGGVPLMSLKSSGNLGLGTTTPGYPLEVQSGFAVGRFTTTNGNGAVLILKNTATPTTFLGAINFDDATGTPGQIGYLASGQMTFRVAGTDRMNLQAGGLFVNGAVVLTSDRNAKADFASVDAQEVLAKVAALPLHSWSYTNRPGVKHVGPMAQDFRAAFGLGEDDRHIATVDADGVALAAIQGLNQKVEEQRAENTELKQRLDKLEQLLQSQSSHR
jgi:hypothetical protein